MANKNKKQKLKERNPYAYYRNWFVGLKTCKWLSILAPFITLFAVNFNEYFIFTSDTGATTKLSLGCVLACLVGGIAMYSETKKKEDGTKGKSPLSNIVGWGIAFALCFFFQSILNDLTLIIGCGLVGQLVGFGFELGAQNRAYYMNEYKKANIQSKVLSKANQEVFNQLIGKGKNNPYE